jgi:hypothetical protein
MANENIFDEARCVRASFDTDSEAVHFDSNDLMSLLWPTKIFSMKRVAFVRLDQKAPYPGTPSVDKFPYDSYVK